MTHFDRLMGRDADDRIGETLAALYDLLRPLLSSRDFAKVEHLLHNIDGTGAVPAQDEPPAFRGMPKPGGTQVPLEAPRRGYSEADYARHETRQVLSAQDSLPMDSAAAIYRAALNRMGISTDGMSGAASLRAVFRAYRDQRRRTGTPLLAVDAADAASFDRRFPGAARIRQSQ